MTTATATTRSYYAATYPYGVASNAESGRLIRTIYRFETREERDRWVEDRKTDYRGNSGYRHAVPSTDRELRRELRLEAANEHEIRTILEDGTEW